MCKNVIVTGVTGFVGRYLVKELLQNQYSVYAVVRDRTKLKAVLGQWYEHQNLHAIEADLACDWGYLLPELKYDTFFHLGWAGVNREEINDISVHKNSYEFSMKCLEVASNIGCRCFISSGSKAEYGAKADVQNEDTECCPDSAYGKEKLRFYQNARLYCKKTGMRYFHGRLFSIIGMHDHSWSLVSTACSKFSGNEEMQLGPCTQKWNFTAVEDVVRGLRYLCEYDGELNENDNSVYNIASQDTRVLKDFVKEIHSLCNSQSDVFFADDINVNGCMNPTTDKIRQLTGWNEMISFEECIKRILSNDNVAE